MKLVSDNIDIGNVMLWYDDVTGRYETIYGGEILQHISKIAKPGMDNRVWTIIQLTQKEYNTYGELLKNKGGFLK